MEVKIRECRSYNQLFEAVHKLEHEVYTLRDITILYYQKHEIMLILKSGVSTPVAAFNTTEICNHEKLIREILHAI
ncbi:hypothetical protein J2Z48_001751 [Croceifilum oryzae]|uniref:Uncharacterized protein n=1 Tax=Croceifilum oryzae TaxID=1553429 RepID=A0AAJ1WSN8_9BACL|nr:hypothetical protein [Croceifilum oryzae]MDQ0417578.1 hypothetical protein [Croceifilum oryzae]